jgi:type I restriction enzyme M protein
MLKTTEIKSELRPFNALFGTLQYRHEISTVFDDLLTIIICCMGRGTNEKLYFETIKKYTKEELNTFPKMLAELVKLYEDARLNEDWCDPLGEYYEALASNYKKSNFGQFFTPKEVCDLMAQLTITSNEWGKNIYEPCSGSGRLVLAGNKVAEGNYYVCEDLDPICAKMTAINLCFHHIRGEVLCRDVLRQSEPRFSFMVNYEFWKHKTPVIFMYMPS